WRTQRHAIQLVAYHHPATGSTSSIAVNSVGTGSLATASLSTLVSDSGSAEMSVAPHVSGQPAGDDGIYAMLDALISAQNNGTPMPSAPVDHVFASSFVMSQMQTNLLVGKRSPNNFANNYAGEE